MRTESGESHVGLWCGRTAKGTVSPSVYMKKAMGVGGENLKKLCNAMYFYNNEAVVYSKSK